jgi:hypothetical protein
MPSSNKAIRLPSLLAGIGALTASAAFIAPISELLRAYVQIGGGVAAMIGGAWLVIVQLRQRTDKS